MAIIINHRFLDRLDSVEGYERIESIVIGTFNPGEPEANSLSNAEKLDFDNIKNTDKYKAFSQIRNFYDRPQNRLWKIMDYFDNTSFYTYSTNGLKTKNENGLKFYKNMNRGLTFQKQSEFCRRRGILITDIIRTINPDNFRGIYDNFSDSVLDKVVSEWNTGKIIDIIDLYQPQSVLVTFNHNNPAIPNISSEINRINESLGTNSVKALTSPSGSAGVSYQRILEDWRPYFV